MEKVIKWYKENSPYIVPVFIAISIVLTVFLVMFMVISEDLVNRVKSQENDILVLKKELKDMTYERNECSYQLDQTNQLYEDVVPLWQYVYDIEYLESVIRELRGQE